MRLDILWGRAEFGCSWFYWIAAISVVQSVLYRMSPLFLLAGLKACGILELKGSEWANSHGAIGFLAMVLGACAISAPLALMGWLAGRRQTWAYILGTLMLAGDGALFVIWGLEFWDNQLSLLVRLVVLGIVGWGLISHFQAKALLRSPGAPGGGPAPLLNIPKNHPSRKDDLFNDPERLGRR